MEDRVICPECDNDEFHVLILGDDEFVQFKCIECDFIIRSESANEPLKKFKIDRCIISEPN